ncbi:MAG: hypothetical protein GXP26_14955 [Planctomycetes bacterium]|nr:hypothetical protein [Planctomycetota bacterium]
MSSTAQAAVPTDTLMSSETRGYASVLNIHTLKQHWQQTQMGQLVQDEAMKPFVKDLKRQLQRKMTGINDKLGLQIEDLSDIAGGEIGLGIVGRDNERAVVSLVVDTTGREFQREELLEKVAKELAKRDAIRTESIVSGTKLTTFTIPPQKRLPIEQTAVFFVKDNMLCASDSPLEAREMLRRFDGQAGGRLVDVPSYQETVNRCLEGADGLEPEVRWYLDPFGYARAINSLEIAGKKRPGKDYLKILDSEGFSAIKGIGGFVNLAVGGSFELLHRTAIYAPPIPGEPDKYRKAMRMMKFPNSKSLSAKPWLPRKLASYRTFNCDLANAFNHFESLFDKFAGYDEAFAGVLEGLERDPYGPQVDVKEDFVKHLGQRIVLVTDYEVPITPKCERFLFVVELANEAAVAATVQKFMENDPDASRTEFEGKTVWEIQAVEEDISDLDIEIGDLDLLDSEEDDELNADATEVPASAVCVTGGHLYYASHTDFLKRILSQKGPEEVLSSAGDYREVDTSLSRLLSGPISARTFLRTDEVYRPIYELLRQGKMPESETLFGRLLNRMLTPPDDEDEGILREQKIDGRKLPDFEMVRRYFGPAGTIIRSDDDGWFVVGATLSKLAPQLRADNSVSVGKSTVR